VKQRLETSNRAQEQDYLGLFNDSNMLNGEPLQKESMDRLKFLVLNLSN